MIDAFIFWLIKPLAEFLGTIVLILVLLAVLHWVYGGKK
jgi:cbb3-type cytochrome oxidase subunit 3